MPEPMGQRRVRSKTVLAVAKSDSLLNDSAISSAYVTCSCLCGLKRNHNEDVTLSYILFININQLDALNFMISLFQASTCFEHMCSSSGRQIVLYSLWYNTICPPDDEHICSKHVEA